MTIITEIVLRGAAGVGSLMIGLQILKYFNLKKLRKQLVDLDDCPFPYGIDVSGNGYYVIFKLCADAALYCEYKFGVRSDGIYGVSELEIRGVNGTWNRSVQLKTGQSIFPLIAKVEEFESWAKLKAFDYTWDRDFGICWQNTIKKIDNLRFLEMKDREKDKKKKK